MTEGERAAAEGPRGPGAGPPPMPELPPTLTLTTDQQFRAIADPVRSRILGIIQTRPATAKQIAKRLGKSPGTIGHHLEVLEAAGLAQVVATRVVHGITAKYFTRTARIFDFHFSPDITGDSPMTLEIIRVVSHELTESLATYGEREDSVLETSFPHLRISPERARVYQKRLKALLDDLLHEPVDPSGQVYGIFTALFLAPTYLQDAATDEEP
jgi:DNA-binding transcriptional ArsR family regulator